VRALLPAVGCALALLHGAVPASAHRLAPALFEIREAEDGAFDVRWKASLLQPTGVDLRPSLPPHCTPRAEPVGSVDGASASLRWTATCGAGGLVGETLRVEGLDGSGIDVIVRVELADGRRIQRVLSRDAAAFTVPERAPRLGVVADFGALGVQHIATGLDHLLFVLGLLLWVHGRRRLVATITAFTVGHSVTLSLAVLGVVAFPARWVEVAIAVSLLVLAADLARPASPSPSPLGRRPWLLAFCFGLLHGFGFAGALAEAGLPIGEIPLALFAFNAGIEAGQLAFVVGVLLLRPMVERLAAGSPAGLARAPVYAMGSLAAYWCFERAAALY
jgi:hydrogenase/urease accessory protein HupE